MNRIHTLKNDFTNEQGMMTEGIDRNIVTLTSASF